MLGFCILLLVSVIWGGGFLAQKMGMDHVGPFAFTVYRNVLASGFLLAVIAVRRQFFGVRGAFSKASVVGGIWCGVTLWIAMMSQQIGIIGTSPGTCAFLTANYALIVPILGLFIGRAPRPYVWAGVALALGGTFLICVKGGEFLLGRGEAMTLLCAYLFAVQMLVVDRCVSRPGVDVIGLSCVQFAVCIVMGLPFMALPSERALLSFSDVRAAAGAIAFAGLLSSGVAYTLQNVGQKLVQPAIAGILLSLESVFGVLFGWLAWRLGWLADPEVMSARRLVGYALVFAAVVLVQIVSTRDGNIAASSEDSK